MLRTRRAAVCAGSGLGTRGSDRTFETVTAGIRVPPERGSCRLQALQCARIFPRRSDAGSARAAPARYPQCACARPVHRRRGERSRSSAAGRTPSPGRASSSRDPGGELALDAGDVHDGRGAQRRAAGAGHLDQHAAAVGRVGQPLDQALLLQPRHLAGKPRLGEQHLGRPGPAVAAAAVLARAAPGRRRCSAESCPASSSSWPSRCIVLACECSSPVPGVLAVSFETVQIAMLRPPDGHPEH